MGQFVGCIRGIGEACKALDFPVVSGNVSLYNETNGRAILPTPTIGGVGLHRRFQKVRDARASRRRTRRSCWSARPTGWLGQSIYLRDICGREEGAPPPVDLARSARTAISCAALIVEGMATAVHDLSDGGLLVALAEMAMASGIGASSTAPSDMPAACLLVRRGPGALPASPSRADAADASRARARAAGVPVRRIGMTGGDALTLAGERPILVAMLARALRRLAAGLYGRRGCDRRD